MTRDQAVAGGHLIQALNELATSDGAAPEKLLIRAAAGAQYAVQYWHFNQKEPESFYINVDEDPSGYLFSGPA